MGIVFITVNGEQMFPASGGGGASTGTFAARPATPDYRDAYIVDSGPRLGSVYACLVPGAWTLVGIELPQPESVVAVFDGERGVGRAGSLMRVWPNLASRGRGYDVASTGVGNPPQPLVNTAVSGLTAYSTAASTTNVRTILPSTTALGPRTIAALVRHTGAVGQPNNTIVQWGANAGFSYISLNSRTGFVDVWSLDFAGATVSSAVAPDAVAHTLIGTYDGATARLYLDGAQVASGAVVMASGADSFMSLLCDVNNSSNVFAELSFAAAWDALLTGPECTDLDAMLRERYGL